MECSGAGATAVIGIVVLCIAVAVICVIDYRSMKKDGPRPMPSRITPFFDMPKGLTERELELLDRRADELEQMSNDAEKAGQTAVAIDRAREARAIRDEVRKERFDQADLRRRRQKIEQNSAEGA